MPDRRIDRSIAGICMAARADDSRLSQGRAVFDALYEYFKKSDQNVAWTTEGEK